MKTAEEREKKKNELEEELGFKLAADLETVPTVYSLQEVYFKVKDFESNFSDWKFVIDNNILFEQHIKKS